MCKRIFLITGLIALIEIALFMGFEPILHAVSEPGPLPLVAILLPMITVYGFEA